MVRPLPFRNEKPVNREHFLVEDHASPVGMKVPGLPDFEVDPVLALRGHLPFAAEFTTGVVMAFMVGAVMIILGLQDKWRDETDGDTDGST